jgi:cytochrome c556
MKPHFMLPLMLALVACDTATQTAATPAPAPDPAWTGLARPMDVIHARWELMDHVELLMEPIDATQVEKVRNADQLRVNAEAIAAMLQALPHLFPPSTNLYKPQGPEFPTLALPSIWKNFDGFYNLAMAASRTADELAATTTDEALRAAAAKLRASCDACHTLYERKYVPQKPQASDYEFDFDTAIAVEKK